VWHKSQKKTPRHDRFSEIQRVQYSEQFELPASHHAHKWVGRSLAQQHTAALSFFNHLSEAMKVYENV